MRVLVVDDMRINLLVAEELLCGYGLRVETAISGAEAVELVEEGIRDGYLYDIIFMDYMMPKMNGEEATEKIRALGYAGKVVMLTGNETLKEEHGAAFDGFLKKPIEVEKLEALLALFGQGVESAEAVKKAAKAAESAADPKKNIRLMKAFDKDARRAIEALRRELESGELTKPKPSAEERAEGVTGLTAVTSVFHAIKSGLANIGESENARLAANLESEGRNGNFEFIAENTPGFIRVLESLLPEFPVENDDSEDEDREFVRRHLEAAKEACEEYAVDSAETEIKFVLDAKIRKATRDMCDKVMDGIYSESDFEGAAEKIEAFLSGY